MNLEIENQLFVVTGATSGIGKAIAISLLNEGANLIINARKQDKLELFQQEFPSQIEIIPGDIMTDATLSTLIRKIDDRQLMGIVVNAEGPPAKSFFKTKLSDWDDAYETILRWKIKLTQEVMPLFQEKKYGRMLFIESSSVKQPIENLILSTSLRLAVVGFVK